jgi:hypothetical protein
MISCLCRVKDPENVALTRQEDFFYYSLVSWHFICEYLVTIKR